METYFSQQAAAFLWAVVLGAALGVLYDWFRIGRILKKKWWLTVFLEDLFFALAAAFATAFCFSLTNYGQVRLFLLAGEGLGFIIYLNTLGVLVTWQARLVARFLQWLQGVLGRFLQFICSKLKKIMFFLKKPFIFLKRWCKMFMYHVQRRFGRVENQSDRKRRKSKKSKKNEPRR